MASGKTQVLGSGLKTSNVYAYTAKYDTLGFGEVAVTLAVVTSQSGVTYTVRGYPVLTDFPAYVKTVKGDTVMTSGASHYLVFSDPYEAIDVGYKSTQSNLSGSVTVLVTGKRRT